MAAIAPSTNRECGHDCRFVKCSTTLFSSHTLSALRRVSAAIDYSDIDIDPFFMKKEKLIMIIFCSNW